MLCPNCGALLAEGSRFCPFCNSAIETREAPSVPTLSLDSGIPEPYRDPSDAGQQPNHGQQPDYGQQPNYGQQPYYGQQPPYNRGYSNGYVPPVSTGGYIAWAILTNKTEGSVNFIKKSILVKIHCLLGVDWLNVQVTHTRSSDSSNSQNYNDCSKK